LCSQKVGIAYGWIETECTEEEKNFHELAIKLGRIAFSTTPHQHLEKAAVFHHNAAVYYFRSKQYELAEIENSETIRLMETVYADRRDHVHWAAAFNERALIAIQRGDYRQASSNLESALNISREFYGDKHPRVAETLHNYGLFLCIKETYELSLTYLFKSLKMKIQLLGDIHPSVQTTLQSLGILMARQSQVEIIDTLRLFEHRPLLNDVVEFEQVSLTNY